MSRSQFTIRALLVATLVLAFPTLESKAIAGEGDGEGISRTLEKLSDAKWNSHYRPTAQTCKYVSELYRSLFAAAAAADLETLRTIPDDSIAIQAAWESVVVTVPAEPSKEPIRLDDEKLSWFLGFLEGRARVSVPEGWRELILNARANRRDNIFLGEPKSVPYHDVVADRVKCPTNASLQTSDNAVVFRIADDTITLPEKIIRRDIRGDLYFNISGCFTSERCFVTVHNDLGRPHDLVCIDRATGKLLWKSTACGCCWNVVYGGGNCWVWVVATSDGRVLVFGAESLGFYVHCFDASDGKSLLHFSSRY
jgi:hypothetical protein